MCRIVRQFSASKDGKCFKKWVKLHLTSESINLPRRQPPPVKIIKLPSTLHCASVPSSILGVCGGGPEKVSMFEMERDL